MISRSEEEAEEQKYWMEQAIAKALRRQRRQAWWMLIRPALIWLGLILLVIVMMATCSRFVAPSGIITIKVDTSAFSDSTGALVRLSDIIADSMGEEKKGGKK